MTKISNLIIYNKKNGDIVFQVFGEGKNAYENNLETLFLEEGIVDNKKFYVEKIDIKNKKPILKLIEKELSEEEKKIVKLEKEKSELIFKLMEEDNGGEN